MMVTRAGVAKRLGISIASVRRMEGHELHPWTDERGVHQFDVGEVEELAAATNGGRPAMSDTSQLEADLSQSRERNARLERDLADARERLRNTLDRNAALEHQVAELRTTSIEALQLVELALGGEVPYGVTRLRRQLERDS